jgi:hypothetical protein
VHGSVLVHDGVLYATAGRNMFLDGGIRFLRLDPLTGKLLGEVVMDDKDPETGERVAVNYSRLDTFYIVFDQNGELTHFLPAYNYYADKTQQYLKAGEQVVTPYVDHPDPSARALLLYDRKQWEELPDVHDTRWSFLARESRPVYINRATGALIEERQR